MRLAIAQAYIRASRICQEDRTSSGEACVNVYKRSRAKRPSHASAVTAYSHAGDASESDRRGNCPVVSLAKQNAFVVLVRNAVQGRVHIRVACSVHLRGPRRCAGEVSAVADANRQRACVDHVGVQNGDGRRAAAGIYTVSHNHRHVVSAGCLVHMPGDWAIARVFAGQSG